MPAITTVALETLFHHPKPSKKNNSYSPSLYATPKAGPIPASSPLNFELPSPYVANGKRRDFLPSAAAAAPPIVEEEKSSSSDADGVGSDDGFVDSRGGGESMSVVSGSSDVEDSRVSGLRVGDRASFASQSEYYDAADDFFSDGSTSNSSPSFRTNTDKELRALRLTFDEEVGRRQKAEEDLQYIRNQWQKMAKSLSHSGLVLPEMQHHGNVEVEPDPVALCQEIIVTKSVFETLERDLAQAEAELVAEAIIESKNHEISRLRDRLQYYEAVNREMSQRNQEAVELARQNRQRRQTRRKLIWGCFGLSVTIGASLLVYSYFPNSGETAIPDPPSPSTIDHGETQGC